MSGLSVWDEEPGLFSDRRLNMPRRPKMDVDMDITPMIDVTFLLLIFFLVASRVAQDTEVTLPAATASLTGIRTPISLRLMPCRPRSWISQRRR